MCFFGNKPFTELWKKISCEQSNAISGESELWKNKEAICMLCSPLIIFSFFLGRERAERAARFRIHESNPANTQGHPAPRADCQPRHTTVARKQTWHWDSVCNVSCCHTHRWCRLCLYCVLWLAPGRCPADRDVPGRCRPCWRPAAGAGWKSPAAPLPPSSAWWQLQGQRKTLSEEWSQVWKLYCQLHLWIQMKGTPHIEKKCVISVLMMNKKNNTSSMC